MDRIFQDTPYSGRFNVGRYTAYMEDLMRVKNAIGLCTIYTYQALLFADDMAQLYSAAVGEEVTARDLIQRGERIGNLAKIVNVRDGFSRADDQPPDVWFRPMNAPEGCIEMEDYYQMKVLTRDDLARMLDDYYDERGWDIATGHPTPEKLDALGLRA
jgi:aldehyde:ferredoxin oxidoreductase